MLIAYATGRDSLPRAPRQSRSARGPLTRGARLRLAWAWAWFGLVLEVWQERRVLSRLTASQRQDIGLHAHTVSRELDRSLFDLPRDRVAALYDAERRRARRRCGR